MEVTKRQTKILDRVIREYVDRAQPIASQLLKRKYRLAISPATIRIEMQRLTDKGFLYRPYISSGRVPTDKGYRFFVDKLFEEGFSDLEEDLRIGDWARKEMKDSLKFIQNVTRALASASSSLTVSYLFDDKVIWKEGWEELLQEPEFKTIDCISNFAKALKAFEKELEGLKLNSQIKVFIGRENPFPRAKDFSIIISRCYWPEREKGIISLLGPKRMNYDRNIALINSFRKILENF